MSESYFVRITRVLDDNPGKRYTAKELQGLVGLAYNECGGRDAFFKALRSIYKFQEYKVTYMRSNAYRGSRIAYYEKCLSEAP